ncbi:MAG: type II secretion system F family protein [Dethiobacteria bacterium]
MIVARFSRTLGTLLASGVGLVTALELVEKVINNVVLAGAMAEARRVIRQGQTLALPLAASGLFPPMLVEMVHIGEESGALDGMLSRTADFYEGELTFYPGPAELSHRAGAHCLRGDLRGASCCSPSSSP